MPTIVYLANQFPSPVEPYVADEIAELRRRGCNVLACSARRPSSPIAEELRPLVASTLYLQPARLSLALRAGHLCCSRSLQGLMAHILRGSESVSAKVRALAHTWLGACLALQLEGRGVQHLHVHHGYFASWVGMAAARLLGASFSFTLHGSDLLLHRRFFEIKLRECKFCFTVSGFNRRFILENYPQLDPQKIFVRRLGVEIPPRPANQPVLNSPKLTLLAAGRLHAVKDHAFLIQACRKLKERNVNFVGLIAGDGPERNRLQRTIGQLGLARDVVLLGHLSRRQLDHYYALCDVVVLTSRSEGIPQVLMEAMAREKCVLAPAITGIPELVEDGRTGFLYQPGCLADFVAKIEFIRDHEPLIGSLRRAARQKIFQDFNRDKNLAAFANFFLNLISLPEEKRCEDSLLQQI